MNRWSVAILVSIAIAISYLDRQAFPLAIKAVQADIPISNTVKANLDTAFLVSYGLMYLVGGRLLDVLGTRRGFALVMLFWSLACASHGLAHNAIMLAASRLLLGMGEGGGFPAATRVVAESFPVDKRSTAMGIINAGTGVGGVVAGPLITLIILRYATWLHLAPWRWVFFIAGAMGLAWTLWWVLVYSSPTTEQHEKTPLTKVPAFSLLTLLSYRQTWGIILAKFCSDAAWYFYLFWLPSYLLFARHFNYRETGSVIWIPPAASILGCMLGGSLSSWLISQGKSVNASRKIALAASAAMMPLVILVPFVSVPWVIAIFSVAYFGQQSWSTLVMVLPTDLFPKQVVGTVAGLVGLGGAAGGVVLGQAAGYLLDHGYSYVPVLSIAGSLHILAFIIILLMVKNIRPVIPETTSPTLAEAIS